MGYEGLSDSDLAALTGIGGGPTELMPGQTIYSPEGQKYTILDKFPEPRAGSGVTGRTFRAQTTNQYGTVQNVVLPPGVYATLEGTVYDVSNDGQISASRTMTQKDREFFGLPFTAVPDDGAGGGGGRGPVVAGAAAPDPAGALNALANYYRVQIEADQIPFDQAVQEFNRWAGIVGIQQETSRQELERASAIETGERGRQIARSQTQLGAASERTARGEGARQMLRSSLPSNINLNVPLLGNISQLGTRVNPDQFFDIQGLNAIQLPNAQVASALQNFRTFQPNVSAAPTLPAPTQVPASPIDMNRVMQLVNQAAAGFPGWVY